MFYIDTAYQSNDRLDQGKLLLFQDNWYDNIPSYFMYKIKSLPIAGTLVVTNQIFRPDLISFDIYGDVQYKGWLMIYNDIIKKEDIISGRTIRYPSVASMETVYFTLTALQAGS